LINRADIKSAGGVAHRVRTYGKPWRYAGKELLLEAWERDKPILACELSFQEWNQLELAVSAIQRFQVVVGAIMPDGFEAGDDVREVTMTIMKEIESGMVPLMRLRDGA
jgi:hypothetical protein